MAINDDLRAALIQELDSKFKEQELLASNNIAKYNESTKTYYADEELAKLKVPQSNNEALFKKLKEEQMNKPSLEEATKKFAERLKSEKEFERDNAKNIKGVSLNVEGHGSWHTNENKGRGRK